MQKNLNLQNTKQTLTKQREILLARLERKQESIQTNEVLNPDKNDRAMTSRYNNREILLLNRTEQQLHDINQALKHLKTGSYGVCSKCSENIQPARLEIMPIAALCIKCQRIQDTK